MINFSTRTKILAACTVVAGTATAVSYIADKNAPEAMEAPAVIFEEIAETVREGVEDVTDAVADAI